jgi:ubiquitin carboxyl-terminal hydrolase 34
LLFVVYLLLLKVLENEEGKFCAPDDREYYRYNLTGIIVHTGTAETGHYYSFVKERVPLVNSKQGGRWISFNDSSVEEYDVAQIPADCFGGLSDAVRVDPKTNQSLPPEEKSYSAYMLVYERVGVQHDPGYSARAHSNVSKQVLEQVWEGNGAFALDKGVFHEDYFGFLWALVRQHQEAPVVLQAPPLATYDPVFQAIRLGTKFVFETLCRAKQKHHLQQWMLELTEMYRRHLPACRWLMRRITKRTTWIEAIFFYCPSKSVREILADFLVSVMEIISAQPTEPESYVDAMDVEDVQDLHELAHVNTSKISYMFMDNVPSFAIVPRFVDSLFTLVDEARSHWRSFGEFWKLFEGFVRIGERERQFFNMRRGCLILIDCYLGDASPAKQGYPGKEARKRMAAKNGKADIVHLVGTVATIVTHCRSAHPRSHALPEMEKSILTAAMHNTFLKWALFDGTVGEELCNILEWVGWDNRVFSETIMDMMIAVVNELDAGDLDAVFNALERLLSLEDSHADSRALHFVRPFLQMMEPNAKYKGFTLRCVEFLVRLSAKQPRIREELFRQRVRWLKRFLVFDSRAVRVEAEKLVKTLTGESAAAQAADEFQVVGGGGGNAETLDPAVNSRCSEIVVALYELMPSLVECLKVDKKTINTPDLKVYLEMWMLNNFFRCLLWCVRSMTQVELFLTGFEAFRVLYLALEASRNEADLNRKELIRFWHKCFGRRASPESPFVAFPFLVREMMLKDETLLLRFVDFFVSLRSSSRYLEYNNVSLVPFYEMLLSLLEVRVCIFFFL